MATAAKAAALNPLIEAVRRAPLVRALTPEQRAELEQDMADIAAGRVQLVPHDDVPAWLEARARGEE
jgi:predicted transcriptional regulator